MVLRSLRDLIKVPVNMLRIRGFSAEPFRCFLGDFSAGIISNNKSATRRRSVSPLERLLLRVLDHSSTVLQVITPRVRVFSTFLERTTVRNNSRSTAFLNDLS